MTSEPARARSLWAIISLVLPVTFGYTTACRSPALTFPAVIHFAMKRFAPCPAVWCHSPSPWPAAVHWSAWIPENSEIVQETPHPFFFLVPHVARVLHQQFSEHNALRQSRIFMRAKNPAYRIRLLRTVAPMLSLSELLIMVIKSGSESFPSNMYVWSHI